MTETSTDVWQRLEQDEFLRPFLHGGCGDKKQPGDMEGMPLSQQLSKLAEGITLLDKELQQQVSDHYEDLLSQGTWIEKLEGVLGMMQTHVQCLLSSVERLRTKIVEPYNKIQTQTMVLSRLHATCDMLRRIIRILQLSKRLQVQMKGGIPEITKAAQSLNELDQLSQDVDLSGLEVIEEDQRTARVLRLEVERQAKLMMAQGLESQNQSQVGTALQVFYNLGSLQSIVREVLESAKRNILEQVKQALDIQNLTKSSSVTLKSKGAPGRAVMPSPGNTAAFRNTLWSSVEKLMDGIHAECCQVALLQRVLAKKRDPGSHICFMELLKSECKDETFQLERSFWDTVTNVLSQELLQAAQASGFIKQAFEGEYPKLLRLYLDLWKRLQQFSSNFTPGSGVEICSSQVDEVYKEGDTLGSLEFNREVVLPFENAYLSCSMSRLFDPLNLMFSSGDAVPSQEEVDGVVRIIASELSISLVDVALSKTIAKNVSKTVKLFCVKSEQMVVTDGEATQVIDSPTSGQALNAAIVNLLFYFEKHVKRVVNNISALPQDAVSIILDSLNHIEVLMVTIIKPLVMSISDAIEAIILTMHKEDFSQGLPEGSNSTAAPCSLYMKELQAFIARAASNYLSQFQCQEVMAKCVHPVACRCLDLFVRHACLVRPLGEGGKMRLAADFAEMELAVTPLCQRAGELGKPYRVLRSFRPLLFQTYEDIVKCSALGDVIPYSLVLHFLFARAPQEMQSPHQSASWSVSRYSQWLDDHSDERERLELVGGALQRYQQIVRMRREQHFHPLYPIMVELLEKGMAALK